jgi:hypothetical protein
MKSTFSPTSSHRTLRGEGFTMLPQTSTLHRLGVKHAKDVQSVEICVPREVVPLWLWVSNHKREIFDPLCLILYV